MKKKTREQLLEEYRALENRMIASAASFYKRLQKLGIQLEKLD